MGWDVGVAWQDGRAFHGPCHIRMAALVLFLPTLPLYYNYTAWVYAPAYAVIVLLGMAEHGRTGVPHEQGQEVEVHAQRQHVGEQGKQF